MFLVVVGLIAGPASRATRAADQTAVEIRQAAVEALGQIETGADPSHMLSPQARTFAQALAAARAILSLGSLREQVRRNDFIEDESASFQEAFGKIPNPGPADRDALRGRMTGVQWAYVIFGRPLAPGPERDGPPDWLLLKNAPIETLDAVLWSLTERAPHDWGEATRGAAARLTAALAERLARAPKLGPDRVEPLRRAERDGLDLDLLRRLNDACQKGLEDHPSYVRLVVLVAAAMIADGRSPDEVASEAVPAILKSANPRDSWGQVIVVLSAVRALGSHDAPRLSNGKMLLAYLKQQLPASATDQQRAVAYWLAEYLGACRKAHPIRDDGPRPLEKPALIQADVYRALLEVVSDTRYAHLDPPAREAGPDWRSEVTRTVLALDLSSLGDLVNEAGFGGTVGKLNSAVLAHGELAPRLLELLAWRPEFWEPETWVDKGVFSKWPEAVRKTVGRDVIVHRRLLDRFWGNDRLAPPPRAGAAKDSLLDWVQKEVAEEPQATLAALYRAVARVLSEDDLYLTPDNNQDDASSATDRSYEAALKQLADLLPTSAHANSRGQDLISDVGLRYGRLRESGPGAHWATFDGFNYHDPRFDDAAFALYLPMVLRGGEQAAFDQGAVQTVGGWRVRTTTTLFWLAAAHAHERLAERNYLRAGFVFTPQTDFKNKGAIESVRLARRHFLAAQVLYQLQCRPILGVKHPYGDPVEETPSMILPDPQPTPLQAVSYGPQSVQVGRSLLAAVIQTGLVRTKVQLARLESGLDATGQNGAIMEDLKVRGPHDPPQVARGANQAGLRGRLQAVRGRVEGTVGRAGSDRLRPPGRSPSRAGRRSRGGSGPNPSRCRPRQVGAQRLFCQGNRSALRYRGSPPARSRSKGRGREVTRLAQQGPLHELRCRRPDRDGLRMPAPVRR